MSAFVYPVCQAMKGTFPCDHWPVVCFYIYPLLQELPLALDKQASLARVLPDSRLLATVNPTRPDSTSPDVFIEHCSTEDWRSLISNPYLLFIYLPLLKEFSRNLALLFCVIFIRVISILMVFCP